MNRTITWINKTGKNIRCLPLDGLIFELRIISNLLHLFFWIEGRDKFCKAIQYASRILKWHFANTGNKEMAARFTGIFSKIMILLPFHNQEALMLILNLLSRWNERCQKVVQTFQVYQWNLEDHWARQEAR